MPSRSSDVDLSDRDPRRHPKAPGKRSRGGAGGGHRSQRWRVVRLIATTLLVGAIVATAVLTTMFLYFGSDPNLPTFTKIADYRPRQMSRVLDRDGKPIGELGIEKRTLVPLAKIPKPLVQALVAAEDPHFYEHGGFDFRGMVRAVISNLLEGEIGPGRWGQGGSTITQQVVKQLLLTPEKTLRRKVQELILARQISDKLSKEEILEVYLNHMYFGHGRYGVEEAAQFYFGKPVGDVELAEAALLAGLPQSPERLSPRKHMEAAKARQRYVLEQMVQHGYLRRATAEKVWAAPIVLAPEPMSARGVAAPEVTDAVYRHLSETYGQDRVSTLGTTVKTTVDARLQEMARQALEKGLEDLDERQGYRGPTERLAPKALEKHRAALKSARGGKAPRDGEIIEGIVARIDKGGTGGKGRIVVDLGGVTGAVDYGLEHRYSKGTKPLGERFKAGDVVRVRVASERRRGDGTELALALELGPQAAMVVMDPQTRDVLALVGGYGFRAGGFDRSQRALRQAGSAFKPFVYAAAIDSGKYTAATLVNDAPEVYDLWKPQNFEKETFRGPTRLRVALGHSINTVAIRLLADVGVPAVRDLAAKAGVTSALPDSLGLSMALGSASVTPMELANAYATFASGGQRAEPRLVLSVAGEELAASAPQQVLRPEVAYVVTSLMRSVVEEGTARSAGTRLRRPLAGKTGTSNGSKDAWFVGFSPDLLAAVWVGFDDSRSLGRGEAGGRSALPIWTDFMSRALGGRPVRDFAQPPGVEIIQIDPATGLRAPAGVEGVPEVFLAGSAPIEEAPAQGEETSADKLLLERN